MPELHRFLPGTRVSHWAAKVIAARPGPLAVYGGYWAGGGSSIDVIDKVAFSDDTRATLDATLSGNSDSAAGCANSRVAGYVGGGNEASRTDRIDKISFPGDGRSTLTATLANARWALAAVSKSGAAGFWCMGNSAGDNDTVDMLIFANETNVAMSCTMSTARYHVAGMADAGHKGYVGGCLLYTSPSPRD